MGDGEPSIERPPDETDDTEDGPHVVAGVGASTAESSVVDDHTGGHEEDGAASSPGSIGDGGRVSGEGEDPPPPSPPGDESSANIVDDGGDGGGGGRGRGRGSGGGGATGAVDDGEDVEAEDGSSTNDAEDEGSGRRGGTWNKPILRATMIVLGLISLGLAALGVILPGLPTTVFVLIAAYCFARSSERFHNMLLNNRIFGPIIRDWNEYRALPSTRVKVTAVTVTLLAFTASIVYFALFSPIWWMSIILAFIALCVVTYLLRLPVVPRDDRRHPSSTSSTPPASDETEAEETTAAADVPQG